MTDFNAIRAMITGGAIGDALGVPVEFQSREELSQDPVLGMRGYGTHYQPPGTWSDDTSMTLCLLGSLSRRKTIDYLDIMENFTHWLHQAEFTATGVVFDVGIATQEAIARYEQGTPPLECGGKGEQDNGNGSLMRIAPLALYLHRQQLTSVSDILDAAHKLSCLTHAHTRSQMACGIYTLIALNLLEGRSLASAISEGLASARAFYEKSAAFSSELSTYGRLWELDAFAALPEAAIQSSGYVVHTLEAVIWCLLNSKDYASCVLKAVNLGNDTDTIAAIAGGLAGLAYGRDSIPAEWKSTLAKCDYIDNLCLDFLR
ncbi:ADP-ribosylglycohydrolase family protein [Selenomonas sp. AB3002]|uniref:ADP-ribosylglycohydrolase family protein n=1 Tax=Selenomonas sp. AB3002 TaxID=1392502 RepID=UPI000495F8A6